MVSEISIDKQALTEFCQAHGIRKLSLFGSVLRDDFSVDSDVDVLVEFQEGHVPGFFELSRMERTLSLQLGRKADLRTPNDLSRYFRDEVVREAAVQYVA